MEKYQYINLFTLELGKALCDGEHLESILKSIVEIREKNFEQHGVVIPHGNNDIEIIDEKSTTEKKLKLIKLV